MPVRLIQGCPAQPLGLPTTDADTHWRIVTGRTAKGAIIAIERDEQDRRRTATPPGRGELSGQL
jgi:hypothetical protein